jgi:hypothetical protein
MEKTYVLLVANAAVPLYMGFNVQDMAILPFTGTEIVKHLPPPGALAPGLLAFAAPTGAMIDALSIDAADKQTIRNTLATAGVPGFTSTVSPVVRPILPATYVIPGRAPLRVAPSPRRVGPPPPPPECPDPTKQ